MKLKALVLKYAPITYRVGLLGSLLFIAYKVNDGLNVRITNYSVTVDFDTPYGGLPVSIENDTLSVDVDNWFEMQPVSVIQDGPVEVFGFVSIDGR